MATKSVGLRLSHEDEELRNALAKHLGVNRSSVIRLALRKLARAEGVPIPETPEPAAKLHAKKKRNGGR